MASADEPKPDPDHAAPCRPAFDAMDVYEMLAETEADPPDGDDDDTPIHVPGAPD